jgi:hypothetical protein
MSTFNLATYGLLLIARRHPDLLIATSIAHNTRQSMLQQIPTIIRSNAKDPRISKDAYGVTSLAFSSLRHTDI